jgi:outer membrane protein
MRKTVIPVVLALAVLFAGASFAEGLRVAVIDVHRILNESEAGQAAKKKMEARYEELKKAVDAKQEEARKLKEELDKQKVMLGKEKLKEKEDALQARVNELRQLTQEGEREMQARQGELTRDVLKRIEVQVDAVVKADKLDLVLERSNGVVHHNDSLDITARVLVLVNRSEKDAGANKAAAAKKEAGAKKDAGAKKEGGGVK